MVRCTLKFTFDKVEIVRLSNIVDMKSVIEKVVCNSWTSIFIVLFLFACAEDNSNVEVSSDDLEKVEEKLDEVDSKRAVLVESIIRSSPTLSQTGEIFADLSTDFNRDYLNDINNVSKYTTLKSQGINLGIYMADLGYITTFEQSQEVIFYLNSAQKLAEAIGVSDVFNESTVERMEMNINDKDSVIEIISELYWKTDAFLKELNRENISALIICGGWVEGLHIGSRLIQDGYDSDMVYMEIYKQEKNLKKILTLLATFEGDENIDMFETRLGEIYQDYQTIEQVENNTFSPEQKEIIANLASKIEALRNEVNKA